MWKKSLGVLLAVLLALMGTGILVAYVRTAEQRALAGEELVDVLVVTEAAGRGTPGSELAGRVRVEQVPAKVRSTGAVDDLAGLEDQVTTVSLMPGEQLLRSRFTDPEQLSRVEVPEGMLQVTLALEPQRALGGNVRAGQTVGVVASFTGTGEGEASGETTHLILHKVLVTHVQMTNRTTGETAPGTGTSDATGDEGSDTTPGDAPSGEVLVTVAGDAPSIERIVFAQEHGSVWLGAEPDDAPEAGTTVQTRATVLR